ncbi:MAG: glycosyltransferase, partial [Chitinophagaceae bacterium]|nr:glycosyltransferase [Chitinophagaceae bacterium]
VLLMTSAYEGFPMLIKEGMANGCIPVVTALEGNKMHLYNNRNALLILNPEDEENVIKQGYAHLQWLTDNNRELQRLSDDCYSYAKEHFDKATFTAAYHTFLLNEAALR